MIANEENSPNCQEEDFNNPFADSFITLRTHIINGQEEVINMAPPKGTIPWNKGKTVIFSEETRLKLSASLKGRDVWNKGRTGVYSEESIRKMSESHKGQKPSSPFKKGNIPWNKGTNGIYSKQYINILSESHKGQHNSPKSEFKKGTPIELHPRWMGGISFEPYCLKFNKQLKEHIRDRDNHICQLCGIKENGEKLSIHHIHYDKPNCEPDLIALCRNCNSKANSNREYHENLFMKKLKERGLI